MLFVRRSKGAVRSLLALVCAALLVLAAACGDDSGGGAASDDGATADDTTDRTAAPDDLFDGVLGSDECLSALSAISLAAAGAFMPGTELDDSVEALERLAGELPPPVAADLDVIIEAFEQFGRALESAGVDLDDPSSFADPQVAQALSDVGGVFDDAEVQQASENVEAYFAEACPELAP